MDVGGGHQSVIPRLLDSHDALQRMLGLFPSFMMPYQLQNFRFVRRKKFPGQTVGSGSLPLVL